MPVSTPSMPTIGQIAHRLNAPIHRVQYVIRARDIRPCGWAGNARVFSEEAVEEIARELAGIDAAKSRHHDREPA